MVTTNPMRMLAAAGIGFEAREYQYDESDLSGVHAAAELGLDPDCTFKTLVLRGDKNGLFVCCIPVGEEVDLKKAAVISGNKKARDDTREGAACADGVYSGRLLTHRHEEAASHIYRGDCPAFDRIAVSAGIRGQMLMLDPEELREFVGASYGEIVK